MVMVMKRDPLQGPNILPEVLYCVLHFRVEAKSALINLENIFIQRQHEYLKYVLFDKWVLIPNLCPLVVC